VGWSHRHLIARFRQQVGLTPKIGARLVRLDAVWRHIEKGGPLDWGQVAADAGYADQAHLIRDFRQFTGITPTEFLARALPPSRIEKGRSNLFKTPPSLLPNLPRGTDLDGQIGDKQYGS
jgi:AraC-like DNA-binding protein